MYGRLIIITKGGKFYNWYNDRDIGIRQWKFINIHTKLWILEALYYVCGGGWGGGLHWAVSYNSPQSFKETFFHLLAYQLWELLLEFFVWFIKLSFKFQLLIVIFRRGNFVYHHRGCICIYRPLACPFRYLCQNTVTDVRTYYIN